MSFPHIYNEDFPAYDYVMATGEMTELLKQSKIPLERFLYNPFAYNGGGGVFLFGDQMVGGNSPDLDANFQAVLHPDLSPENLPEVPLALAPPFYALNTPITTPKMYRWLKWRANPVLFEETAGVMREVYAALGNPDAINEPFDPSSPYGFNAGLFRDGIIKLQTLGDCACLAPDPDGILIGPEEREAGYAEYLFHLPNVERPAQFYSLLAGLGYLAYRCTTETTQSISGNPLAQ